VFGLKDPRTVELGQGYQSRFTESLGYIVFAVYNWGAVIVLLNMLIAMMTRSFDKIAVSRFDFFVRDITVMAAADVDPAMLKPSSSGIPHPLAFLALKKWGPLKWSHEGAIFVSSN